jgi:PAS domain-containing protein
MPTDSRSASRGNLMNINSALTPVPYGLLELDAQGTVIYYKSENKGLFTTPESEIVGRNFFTDIAAIAGAKELQNEIKDFRRGHVPAYSFNFAFALKNRSLPVRVLLARVRERLTLGGTESVESLYVHIRPVADRMAA